MKEDSTPVMTTQARRMLPVVLAGLLQLMPMLRTVIPVYTQGAAPSAWAIVLRLASGAVVALGSFHAVSGASVAVNINSATNDTGQVGVPYIYYITTTPFLG